jgi:hypothetical protein
MIVLLTISKRSLVLGPSAASGILVARSRRYQRIAIRRSISSKRLSDTETAIHEDRSTEHEQERVRPRRSSIHGRIPVVGRRPWRPDPPGARTCSRS